ncbi:hypothetical protein IW967_02945 [Alicyclobacillus mali]|uniref:Uncharacterized protein n=1 Tax=Alicyclobacillus mali (ex Roth et al. 2021) TaxID=1123961 RepID=A0ABS0F0L5_9BACL|nr:hypothetical protein [Alicyclobacillus mali (ex Roth et al. 2021)]MBF8376830.1 hypothetical protein [Alicyclobacillus mali (ex Roth et al. 2021)]
MQTEEIQFNSEQVASSIEAYLKGLEYASDEWLVVPYLKYRSLRIHPVKEFWIRIKRLAQFSDEGSLNLLVVRRTCTFPLRKAFLDQIELMTYAWNVCLWLQEAAATTMYQEPRVVLACRFSPFREIEVQVRLPVFVHETKSIF